MEIQYSQLKINHFYNTPSIKAARGGIFSGVFQQGHQGTSQGQEDFELSWYLFFQQLQEMHTNPKYVPAICQTMGMKLQAVSEVTKSAGYKTLEDKLAGKIETLLRN
jgi:hypothetical protein